MFTKMEALNSRFIYCCFILFLLLWGMYFYLCAEELCVKNCNPKKVISLLKIVINCVEHLLGENR